MTNRTYVYNSSGVNTALLKTEILNSIIVPGIVSIDGVGQQISITFKAMLSDTEKGILDTTLSNHDPKNAKIEEHEVDFQNKQFVHQSSRPLGTDTFYTGTDDNDQLLTFLYRAGKFIPRSNQCVILTNEDNEDNEESDKACTSYYDFKTIGNETYLHEAIVQWRNCFTELITCSVVPTVTSNVPGSYTNWLLYPNGVILPSEAHGNIELTGTPCPVETTPDQDSGISSPGYWNVETNEAGTDFDMDTLTFVPEGIGRYNLFGSEVPLATFVRKIPLLGSTSSWNVLPSSDTARIGHGMRIKMTVETHPHANEQQDFTVCIAFIMHREKI